MSAQYLYLFPRLQASVEKVVMEARDKAVEAVKLRYELYDTHSRYAR